LQTLKKSTSSSTAADKKSKSENNVNVDSASRKTTSKRSLETIQIEESDPSSQDSLIGSPKQSGYRCIWHTATIPVSTGSQTVESLF
jgi:hypothetical protein